MPEKITIGYIAGAGHSGSTLTDLLLGSQPDIASFGEIKNLDDIVSGRQSDGACTCGKKIRKCEVWRPVLDSLRTGKLPTAAVRPKHPAFDETNQEIFRKLAEVTGKNILIDSSKIGRRLRHIASFPSEQFETRVIHLVRDGRAVAFSNARKKRDFAEWLPYWTDKNEKVEVLLEAGVPGMRVHYEELVVDPGATVRKMVAFLGGDTTGEPNLAWAERIRHNVGGNRMRRGESSEIRFDKEYLSALTDEQWQYSWDVIGDTLSKYGYSKARRIPEFRSA